MDSLPELAYAEKRETEFQEAGRQQAIHSASVLGDRKEGYAEQVEEQF